MGAIEELDDGDAGHCNACKKVAETKCTGCKQVYYCGKDCQKRNWKEHKFECKKLPYKLQVSKELGRHLVANRDLKKGEIIFSETPLVVGPVTMSPPVCLHCYKSVDGSYKCGKSGWPVCDAKCEKAIARNPEVVVPHQTEGRFEIESFDGPCYLYDCVAPMRALFMQKTSPSKFKKVLNLQSHFDERKETESWKNCQERVIDVMKKTLGVMIFEAINPELNLTDEMIQRIVGIFETNSVEIRVNSASSEVMALYEMTSMLEHSCIPNIRMSFDDDFKVTIRAGRDIAGGEHLSIMYTHSLWGTHARREHLNKVKKFWCQCARCQDPTELGTNLSTVIRDGKEMRPVNPLDQSSPWMTDDGSDDIPAENIAEDMSRIGADLAILQLEGTIEDYEAFIEKYSLVLHPNHYHLITAKHSLMQMLGRTEGCLIQDMDTEKLKLKEDLCRNLIKVCKALDPSQVRLQIYTGIAMFELHLPLLQYGKRAWESGSMSTEEFREHLKEPRQLMLETLDLMADEENENLPEGQLKIQVKETLSQLEGFMKTIGCEF